MTCTCRDAAKIYNRWGFCSSQAETFVKKIRERVKQTVFQTEKIKKTQSSGVMVIQVARGFSAECPKTNTKVITMANHNRHRQSNEPIRI